MTNSAGTKSLNAVSALTWSPRCHDLDHSDHRAAAPKDLWIHRSGTRSSTMMSRQLVTNREQILFCNKPDVRRGIFWYWNSSPDRAAYNQTLDTPISWKYSLLEDKQQTMGGPLHNEPRIAELTWRFWVLQLLYVTMILLQRTWAYVTDVYTQLSILKLNSYVMQFLTNKANVETVTTKCCQEFDGKEGSFLPSQNLGGC